MIGHLIYSYHHLDDARIQQEIARGLYAKAFGGAHIAHAHNGPKAFGYEPYLEDKLIRLKNRGHYQGAIDLINAGLDYFTQRRIRGLRYVVVTAADTWMLDAAFLRDLVEGMERDNQVLAASSWGRAKAPEKPSGFSTDFFVLDLVWNRKAKLFPVDYAGFKKRFAEFYYLQYVQPTVEAAVQYSFHSHFARRFEDNDLWRNRNAAFRRLVEREPVHGPDGSRQEDWPEIGLYTSPEPASKRAALKRLKLADLGLHAKRLVQAKDLGYYNRLP